MYANIKKNATLRPVSPPLRAAAPGTRPAFPRPDSPRFPALQLAKGTPKRKKSGGFAPSSAQRDAVRERPHRTRSAGPGPAAWDTPTRLLWLKRILLAASFFGMLACGRLWVSRPFPRVPIAEWFPSPGAPWDRILLGALLAALVVAVKFYRPAVLFFLAGVLFLILGDQNRIQPWFYLYAVMLVLTLRPERAGLAGCRIVLSAVYVWSGIQKFNQDFFDSVVPWFVEPARRWLPPELVEPIGWLIGSAGAVELFIGLALWIPPLRRPAAWATVVVHATVLVLLGPLGHGYNLVVWPWNIAMPLLTFVLFWTRKVPHALPDLKTSVPATVIVALFSILPAFSYVGLWDSAMSFCVYSGNTAKLTLFVSPELRDRLPPRIRRFLAITEQGRTTIDVLAWGIAELGVPPLAEPRSFRAVARYVAQYAPTDHDVHLLVAPRFGPIEEYRQSDLR